MVEHIWSVICSRTAVDKESNNVSLFEVLEQLNIAIAAEVLPTDVPPDTPIVIPHPLELVSLWQLSDYKVPEIGHARIRLDTPEGTELSKTFEIDISGTGKKRFRSMVKMNGLPLKGFGIYHFVVELKDEKTDKWKVVARVPLDVRKVTSLQEVPENL